jgi:hypothetical protein
MLTKADNDLLFNFEADVMPDGHGVVVVRSFELSFCVDLERLPLSVYADFETQAHNLPLWAKVRLGFKDIEKIRPEKRTPDLYPANWEATRWREYAYLLLPMLAVLHTGDAAIMRSLQGFEYNYAADVRQLENWFIAVYSALHDREPQAVEYFTHKGKKYRVPADAQTAREYLTWGEASAALQSDWAHHKLSKDGEIPEGEMHRNSLSIVAALAREVRMDKTTGIAQTIAPNKDPKKAEAAYLKRAQAFVDLPACVAIDVGFFLTTSIMRSNVMLSLALPLSRMSRPAMQRVK